MPAARPNWSMHSPPCAPSRPPRSCVKRGPLGCQIIDGDVPASLDDAPIHGGVEVEVLNVLGAGDAFASGFLSGWLRDQPLEACARTANASGALVVSRHGCAPAMPTPAELDYFLREAKADPATYAPPGSRCHARASASRFAGPQTVERSTRLRVRSSQPVLRTGSANRRRRSAHRAFEGPVCRSRRADGKRVGSARHVSAY